MDICFIRDIGIASGHGGIGHAPVDIGFDIAVVVIVAVDVAVTVVIS